MNDTIPAVVGHGQPAAQDVSLGKGAGSDGRAEPRTAPGMGLLAVKRRADHSSSWEDDCADDSCRKKLKFDDAPSAGKPHASLPHGRHHKCGVAVQRRPERQLLDTYTCPICLDAVKNAVATPCGHMMCGECLFGIFKMEALRNQGQIRGQQRLAVLCDMARGVPEACVSPTLSGSSTQSRVLYFLSAQQIASILEANVRSTSEQWLIRLIEDARAKTGHDALRSWTVFLCNLLRMAIVTGCISSAPTAVQEMGIVLATAPSSDLAALLCGNREPDGAVEQAIRDACTKLAGLPLSGGHVSSSSQSFATLPAIWSLFAASALDWVQVSTQLKDASALIHALRQVSPRLSLQDPVAHGPLPQLAPGAPSLGALLEFAQAGNTNKVLASAAVANPGVYYVLDRLSAYLWTLTDASRTFDELFTAAQSQRTDAIRRRDPRAPSGLRLTAEELDPLVGTSCPVCRASIPGGFFGKSERQGVQGLKFKMGKPAPRK